MSCSGKDLSAILCQLTLTFTTSIIVEGASVFTCKYNNHNVYVSKCTEQFKKFCFFYF